MDAAKLDRGWGEVGISLSTVFAKAVIYHAKGAKITLASLAQERHERTDLCDLERLLPRSLAVLA